MEARPKLWLLGFLSLLYGALVNVGGASAADVVAVMRHVHDEVLARQGVDLQPEVKLLGFAS